MVTLNPNWPLLSTVADFTQGPPNLPGVSAMSLDAPARRNVVRKIDIQRGRQYELDQVQAGTATLTITDPLEYLHPANTSSPFNTGGNTITSYRCCQIGAWWNPNTQSVVGNLLNSANPIPGEPWLGAGYIYGYDPSFQNWSIGNPALYGSMTFATSTDHLDGSNTVWKATAQSTSDAVAYAPKVIPGKTYQVFVDVWANTGVTVTLDWTGNTFVSTNTTTTGSFQRISLTFVGDTVGLLNLNVSASTGGFPASFYVSNFALLGQSPGWLASGSPTTAYTVGSLQGNMSAPTDTITLPVQTVPGVTYTFSANIDASGTGTVATQTIGASSVSTTTVNAYQRLVLTFTAADAVTLVVFSATGTSYPATFYINQVQLEVGSSASTFTTSGPTFYPLYTGYVERFPLQWDMQGTRGIRPLTCVDALSILSRTEISQSYKATILADSPSVLIPYSDTAFPQQVQLPQGGQPTQGYTTIGTQGAVNFQGDTFLDGSPAVSVTEQNSNPVVVGDNSRITVLGTQNGSLFLNPQAFTIECWAKIPAGMPYFGAAAIQPSENLSAEPFGPQYGVGWLTFGSGQVGWFYKDPNGTSASGLLPGPFQYPDGQWHYLAIRLEGGSNLNAVVDNVIGGLASISPASTAVQLNNFYIESQAYWSVPITEIAVANLACYSYSLSDAQIKAHYNRGVGYINELSGARVKRLLNQYWQGPINVAAGKRQMAPDNASGGNDYNTRFVLDVLQEIQETERGLVYASAAGVVTFEDSTSRYTNNLTSKWVFGENPPGASPTEYPYSALEEGFDPTYTFSQTNLTRPGNSNFQPLPNPLPANPPYGQRVLSQQVQVNTDFDLYQASTFYLKRYGSPVLRVEKLTLNPAANPALWAVILSLEVSQRITVKRRTSAGLTTTADYYIEQISHSIDGDTSSWTVDLQCSPVFNNSAWILGDPTYGVLGSTTIPVY